MHASRLAEDPKISKEGEVASEGRLGKRFTRVTLLTAVRQLPETAPLAESLLAPDPRLKKWWLRWLSHYDSDDRDASLIYNRLKHPPMIVWLAEVSGIDTQLIRKAVDAIVEGDPCQSQAAAVRRILPWPLLARCLGRITPDPTTNRRQQEEQVGALESRIAKVFGLPRECIKIVGRDGKDKRSDATVHNLLAEWDWW